MLGGGGRGQGAGTTRPPGHRAPKSWILTRKAGLGRHGEPGGLGGGGRLSYLLDPWVLASAQPTLQMRLCVQRPKKIIPWVIDFWASSLSPTSPPTPGLTPSWSLLSGAWGCGDTWHSHHREAVGTHGQGRGMAGGGSVCSCLTPRPPPPPNKTLWGPRAQEAGAPGFAPRRARGGPRVLGPREAGCPSARPLPFNAG